VTPTTVLTVVGARPNFMKAAPIHRALSRDDRFRSVLVHTGQHYDPWMSEVFFRDLGVPEPEFSLAVGSGTHAEQTARVMTGLEPVLGEVRPDLVVVVGDVNSTLAGALTASKCGIRVAHVEAGLRSFDRTMPEEINRVVTDALSDVLLAPSPDAVRNLLAEGHPETSVHQVGNVMIDSLRACMDRAAGSPVLSSLGVRRHEYLVATLHRASNVDGPEALLAALGALESAASFGPVLFVAHPRTAARMTALGDERAPERVRVLEPLGYLDFLWLIANATAVLTDSGGVQEETTVLGVPCLTLRENTERPITVTEGTNTVTGVDPDAIRRALTEASSSAREPRIPAHWDGHAAERVVDVFSRLA
jgi:UDP-N-acetylglucosamine 2-epimerase (non-hydrolysing)